MFNTKTQRAAQVKPMFNTFILKQCCICTATTVPDLIIANARLDFQHQQFSLYVQL